jgi:hypothetical protein
MTRLLKASLLSLLLLIYFGPATRSAASGTASLAETEVQGKFDGPAELPRVYMKTALADTPAPGKVRLVKEGDNLQDVLNSAACGDTIKLKAGATFTGHLKLPKKECDDSRWIVIRTDAPDESLPSEGTRLTPCYAGVASLPARPDFHCSSTRNVMAKIAFAGRGGSGPIFFSEGANHYRLLGLEITRESPGVNVTALASPQGPVAADHIIFDRVWMHGTAQDETTRGIYLSGTRYMAVVDSFFTDFHCAGTCTDAQTIAGATGDLPMGPYKIVNNFLEAAGENIIFGGGPATTTPADIEIRHNYLFKPATWMKGQAGFVGSVSGRPFIVKNLFELKNGQRVLFEGNVLENSWGGFSQAGFAIVLTPKNPLGHLCPLCRVADITIRYNKISHAGGGMQIANVLANGGAAAEGARYSIHDVVFDDIDGATYDGFGSFLLMMSISPVLSDVKIDHVTAFPPRVLISLGVAGSKIKNFIFTNNIVGAGDRQIASAGLGPSNCAFRPEQQGPAGVINSCFAPVTFTNNAVLDGTGNWPPGNFFPKGDAVGLVNRPNNGKGGDYHLCKSETRAASCKTPSRYLHAGTDGKNLGADMDAIDALTQGIL